MTTNLTLPSGFTPRALTSWNKYFIPQSDTNAYRVGDAVHSAGGTDPAGVVAVTLHLGTVPARGVIVAVDPGLPATGGLVDGQKLSVPATKLMGYYVWVLDDPSAVFAMVDDGLTPANSVGTSVGKYANFTPGASPAANGGSSAAIASSTLGATSGCLYVISLQPGSSYGAHATWLLKFAAHELADGGGQSAAPSNTAIARTTAQLAGVPSSADVALGANGQFYDPLQTVDATHPWVYYSASATAYVKIASTGGIAKVNNISPDGSGNVALTPGNVLAVPQAVYGYDSVQNLPALVSGTPPVVNGTPIFALTVVVGGGTITLDGNTFGPLVVGDVLSLQPNPGGTAVVWQYSPTNPVSAAVLGTDSKGNPIKSRAGIDYSPGFAYSNSVPRCIPASGTIADTVGSITGSTNTRNYVDGAWGWFPAGQLYAGSPGQFQWIKGTGAGAFTVYANSWVPGSTSPAIPATLVPLTTVAGTFTQTTALVIMDQVTVPATSLGIQGKIWGQQENRNSSGGGNKNYQLQLNGTAFFAWANTTGIRCGGTWSVQNRGRVDRQFADAVHSSNLGNDFLTHDFSIDSSVTAMVIRSAANVATATDSLEVLSFDLSFAGAPQA